MRKVEALDIEFFEDWKKIQKDLDDKFREQMKRKFRELDIMMKIGVTDQFQLHKIANTQQHKKISKIYQKHNSFKEVVAGFKDLYQHDEKK